MDRTLRARLWRVQDATDEESMLRALHGIDSIGLRALIVEQARQINSLRSRVATLCAPAPTEAPRSMPAPGQRSPEGAP